MDEANKTCRIILIGLIIAVAAVLFCYGGFRLDGDRGLFVAIALSACSIYTLLCGLEDSDFIPRRTTQIVIPIWIVALIVFEGLSLIYDLPLWGIPVVMLTGLLMIQSVVDMTNFTDWYRVYQRKDIPRVSPFVRRTAVPFGLITMGWICTPLLPQTYWGPLWLGILLGCVADLIWHHTSMENPDMNRVRLAYYGFRALSVSILAFGFVMARWIDIHVGEAEAAVFVLLGLIAEVGAGLGISCIYDRAVAEMKNRP